jgi:hypothetical protein
MCSEVFFRMTKNRSASDPLAALTDASALASRRADDLSEMLLPAAREALLRSDAHGLRALLARGLDAESMVEFPFFLELGQSPKLACGSLLAMALSLGRNGLGCAEALLEAGASPCSPVFPATRHSHAPHFGDARPLTSLAFILDEPALLELLARHGASPEGFDALAPPETVVICQEYDEKAWTAPTGVPARRRRVSASHWGAESLYWAAPRCARWVRDFLGEGYLDSFTPLRASSRAPFLFVLSDEEAGAQHAERMRIHEFRQQTFREKRGYSLGGDAPKRSAKGPRACPMSWAARSLALADGCRHHFRDGAPMPSDPAACKRADAALGFLPDSYVFWSPKPAKAAVDPADAESLEAWGLEALRHKGEAAERGVLAWIPGLERAARAERERSDRPLCEPVDIAARVLLTLRFAAELDPLSARDLNLADVIHEVDSFGEAARFGAAACLLVAEASGQGLPLAQRWIERLRERASSHRELPFEDALDALPLAFEALSLSRHAAQGQAARKGPAPAPLKPRAL